MTVHSLLQQITDTVHSWFDMLPGKTKSEHPLIRYGTPILSILVACALLFGLYMGYKWYKQGCEQDAQYRCSVLMDEYMHLQKTESPDFGTFLEKVLAAYQKHKNSAVAPYIGLLAVEAQLKMGNHDAAVASMHGLVSVVQHNRIVGDLFKTKEALLMIDSADPVEQENGFKMLALLADNADNPHRDYALYHLGLYHWNKNDIQEARVVWQELVESQEVELRAPSPWAEVVSEKLATIPA